MIRKHLRYYKRIFSAYVLDRGSSNLAFWHTPLQINPLMDKDLNGLRRYPQNFEQKIGIIKTTDDRGVIMLDYKGDLGMQYNPNAIAQLALGYYDRILAGDDRINEFLQQAAFFIDRGRLVANDVLLWEYNFPFQLRGPVGSPWRSALAQGQGISVCLRAFELSKDERYLNAAHQGFNSFRFLAREHPGGVLDDSRAYTWLEEYIIEPPTHVLNGFIWALWGVRDYAVAVNDSYAWKLWNQCVRTLQENLQHYDLGFWSSYDMIKFNPSKHPTMPTSSYYQRLHVVQLRAMYMITGVPVFDHYAYKWGKQLTNPLIWTVAQVWKVYFKLRWF